MKLPIRADELIATLQLQPHPEGGFYREVFRSTVAVQALDRVVTRSAVTTIYFLLTEGAYSRWHRVQADEIWHWYEGAPLELFMAPPDVTHVQRVCLGPVTDTQRCVATVPAGWWQAARPIGAYALMGCSVAPGFEFDDFTFLIDAPEASKMQAMPAPYDELL